MRTCSTMNNLSADDLQIFREKRRTFRGSVKIPVDKICREESLNNPRQFNKKNVTTSLDFSRSEGCLRLEPEHHTPALISQSAVPQGLHLGGEPPHFNLERPVICMHGRHHLETAQNLLIGNDNRWVVYLYFEGGWAPLAWKIRSLTQARILHSGEGRPTETQCKIHEALR